MTSSQPDDRDVSGWRLVGLLTLFAAATALLVVTSYRREVAHLEEEAGHRLQAVASLKVSQIVQWRTHLLEDAHWVFGDSNSRTLVQHYLASPDEPVVVSELNSWMQGWRVHRGSRRLVLLDATLRPRFAVPANAFSLATDPYFQEALRTATNAVALSELHPGVVPGQVSLDVFIPLLQRAAGSTNGSLIGVLLIEFDPADILFPTIQSWPTPSHSGETLMVRREGDDIVYLNELRHRTNTALQLRLPASLTNLPAARAVAGEEGIVQGLDYRKIPVLAALRSVPGSPWFLVVKEDLAEIRDPLRERAWTSGILAAAVVLAACLGVSLLWHTRESRFSRREIAERRQSEAALRIHAHERERLVRELSRKNADLEAVLYVASHDLRSPLVNIEGFSQRLETHCRTLINLLDQPSVPPDIRTQADTARRKIPAALHFIRSSTTKMTALLSGLLHVTRVERDAPVVETIDANPLIQHHLDAMRHQLQSVGATVTVDPLPPCLGDSRLLGQAFANLLDNAVKYRDPSRPLRLRVTGGKAGPETHYHLEDNGVGIAPEFHEKIWDLFRRLYPEGNVAGDGVGLYLVRRLITRLKGRAWVTSTPGQGSTFHIALPSPPD